MLERDVSTISREINRASMNKYTYLNGRGKDSVSGLAFCCCFISSCNYTQRAIPLELSKLPLKFPFGSEVRGLL